MTVAIEQILKFKGRPEEEGAEAPEYTFTHSDCVSVKQLVKVTCDRQGCDVDVSWDEANKSAAPDAAYRLLVVEFFDGKKLVFCGGYCLRKFLKTHQPLRSPDEISKTALQDLPILDAAADDFAQ
jgi:hypothetical protein